MSNTLGQCDMVLAISETTINDQFEQLSEEEVIKPTWNIIMIIDEETGEIEEVKLNQSITEFNQEIEAGKFDYAFTVELNVPSISIIQESTQELELNLTFKSGTMYYTTSRGRKQVDMAKWKYVFDVKIGKIEKRASEMRWVTTLSQLAFNKIVLGSGIPQDQFLMETVFLDFENTNFATYNKKKSKIDSSAIRVAIFQNLLEIYFKKIAESDNPYILGYSIKVIEEVKENALFAPTAVRYSTSYHEEAHRRAFNFLMMTGHKPFPTGQNVGILPHTLISGSDPEEMSGVFTINADLFMKRMLEKIEVEKHFYNTMDSLHKDFNDFGTYPLISNTGKFALNQYRMSCLSIPSRGVVQWKSGCELRVREYEAMNLINFIHFPIFEFFDKKITFSGHSQKYEFEVWKNKGNKKMKSFDVNLPKFSKQSSLSVEDTKPNFISLGVLVFIDSDLKHEWRKVNGVGFKTKGVSSGYLITEIPSGFFFNFKADAGGKISVEIEKNDFKIKEKMANFDVPDFCSDSTMDNTIVRIRIYFAIEAIKQFATLFQEKIEKALKNLCLSKVILPMGKVYTFKNISFNQPTQTTKSEDNYIKLEVKYAPSI